jgi:hypothetical protein
MSNYLRLKKMLYVVSLAAVSIVLFISHILQAISSFQYSHGFLMRSFQTIRVSYGLLLQDISHLILPKGF